MIAHKTQSTDMAMAGILKNYGQISPIFSGTGRLRKRLNMIALTARTKESLFIRFTKILNSAEKRTKTMESLNADQMVREEDYLAGKVCLPDKAREWKTTYSKQCKCVKQKKIARLMEASGITEEFEMLLFGNFITDGKPDMIKDAYECAMEYFKDFQKVKGERSNSIALLGQPGSGKTHLLTAIMNNLIKKKSVYCMYFPYVEGMGNLRDNFDQLESKLDAMRKADVLFIDDLFKPVKGEPRATDWQVEQIQSVVNYRYLNHKPLLISSELDTAALLDIDEALGSRIHQMCRNYTVIIKGDRMQLNHRLGEWE